MFEFCIDLREGTQMLCLSGYTDSSAPTASLSKHFRPLDFLEISPSRHLVQLYPHWSVIKPSVGLYTTPADDAKGS